MRRPLNQYPVYPPPMTVMPAGQASSSSVAADAAGKLALAFAAAGLLTWGLLTLASRGEAREERSRQKFRQKFIQDFGVEPILR